MGIAESRSSGMGFLECTAVAATVILNIYQTGQIFTLNFVVKVDVVQHIKRANRTEMHSCELFY